jgi:hypothetical protein
VHGFYRPSPHGRDDRLAPVSGSGEPDDALTAIPR